MMVCKIDDSADSRLKIQYKDSEGDTIDISAQDDLDEALLDYHDRWDGNNKRLDLKVWLKGGPLDISLISLPSMAPGDLALLPHNSVGVKEPSE